MKDLTVVSLTDSNVTPRSAIVGFVFFPLKQSDTSLKGTKLQLILQHPSNLAESISEIALEGELPKPAYLLGR
jgi:hypothetical protein